MEEKVFESWWEGFSTILYYELDSYFLSFLKISIKVWKKLVGIQKRGLRKLGLSGMVHESLRCMVVYGVKNLTLVNLTLLRK